MTWIRTIDPGNARGELHDVYDELRGARGKVSDIMASQSLDPASLSAHLSLYTSVMFGRGGLSRADREMVAVVVSSVNRCEYCIAHHTEALRAYWKDEARVRRLAERLDATGLTERQRAMLAYARILAERPGEVTEAHIGRLKDEGMSDVEILNLNLVISYFCFVNRIALGLGVKPSAEEVGGYRY